MSTKPSNPKDAMGIKKAPMSPVPSPVVAEIGLGMLEGALKYGRHNYRAIGVRASVYYDAAQRHMMAWWEGEDLDPDSGLSHVTKALASLTVLRDGMMQENWRDDRPPRPADRDWQRKLDAKAAALIEKYPEPVAPYTAVDQSWAAPPPANDPISCRFDLDPGTVALGSCGVCGAIWGAGAPRPIKCYRRNVSAGEAAAQAAYFGDRSLALLPAGCS